MRFLLGVFVGYNLRGRNNLLFTVLAVVVLIEYVIVPTGALVALHLDVQRERQARPARTNVPSIKGLSYQDAETKLHASNLNIRLLATRYDLPLQPGLGDEYFVSNRRPGRYPDWFFDPKLGGVLNHVSRGHIAPDLHRYLFASVFAEENGRAPLLQDFPKPLLPKHKNVREALKVTKFNDRFRVQLKGRPSTTVVSHISKDGHYFIHYDPTQCRSLTVREAARLQTFQIIISLRGLVLSSLSKWETQFRRY